MHSCVDGVRHLRAAPAEVRQRDRLASCVSEEVVDRHPSVESLVAAAEDRDVIVRHVEAGLCEFASNFVHDGRRRRGAFGEEPESRGGAEGQRGVFPRALGYRLHRGRDERVEQRGRSVRVLGHLFKPRLFRVEHLVHQPRWRPIARVLELEHVHAIARASRVEYHDVPRVAVAAAAEHPEAHHDGEHERAREHQRRSRSFPPTTRRVVQKIPELRREVVPEPGAGVPGRWDGADAVERAHALGVEGYRRLAPRGEPAGHHRRP